MKPNKPSENESNLVILKQQWEDQNNIYGRPKTILYRQMKNVLLSFLQKDININIYN
jgi:hypothetical protein